MSDQPTARQKIANLLWWSIPSHDTAEAKAKTEQMLDDHAAELLPAWEAVYEPGNVSDYLIGYANSEAGAKGAAEAWMRSQSEVTGRLEWVPWGDVTPLPDGYDALFELIQRHDDGIDTGPGIAVRRRAEAGQEGCQGEVDPSACRWCHVPEREHMQRWKKPVGWHQWEQPTQEQIKERMQARRSARSTARLLDCGRCYEEQGEEVHPHPECPIGAVVSVETAAPAPTVAPLAASQPSEAPGEGETATEGAAGRVGESGAGSARITLTRSDLAALLAHHADVLAARWRAVAPGAGAWEVAAALSLTSHANELSAEMERPAVTELLDNIWTFPLEQQDAATEDPAPAEDFTGTQPCGHDDYHDPHPWHDRPNVWCPGIGYDDDQAAATKETTR